MKTLNAFISVSGAIDVEYKRQVAALEAGTPIVQETRRFDADSGKTYSMRSKENDSDYRYFPDPDLPPIHIGAEKLQALRDSIPRLPDERAVQYMKEFSLNAQEAERIVTEAKQSAKGIRLGAKAYANDVLEELENYLGRTGEQVRKSRGQFSK